MIGWGKKKKLIFWIGLFGMSLFLPGLGNGTDLGEINKPYSWNEGLEDLISQILRPLPSQGKLNLMVENFREGNTGKKFGFSEFLEKELKAFMNDVEGVQVIGNKNEAIKKPEGGLDDFLGSYILSGLYVFEGNDLWINAILYEGSSNRAISSGNVVIQEKDFGPETLSKNGNQRGIEQKTDWPDEYQFVVNKLISLKQKSSVASVEAWTDKKTYQIGDSVTFFFRSEQDAYITLIDVGTSGGLRILYPNRFQPKGFVSANQIYMVPEKDSEFSIRVEGPPGLERIKVLATKKPLSFNGDKDIVRSFASLSTDQAERTRELKRFTESLEDKVWAEDNTEFYIKGDGLDPSSEGNPRTIKPKKPKKPIDIIGVPGGRPDQKKLLEESSDLLTSESSEEK